jgi:succinoglycan biosynthesis protein ExoA
MHGGNSRFLVRLDAHADYPNRYCERLLAVQARTKADSVVVSMHTRGRTCLQRAAAAAQNSLLGNGGAAHRNAPKDGWVEHGHHALMTMEAFSSVGGYDESFAQVEDVELDIRLYRSGFKIFLTDAVSVTYYPRRSLIGLFIQYFRVGGNRARNLLKHRRGVKVRHIALLAPAPAIVILALAPLCPLFGLPALLWIMFCIGYGACLGIWSGDRCAAAAGLAAIVTQAGWSFGFLIELVASAFKARKSRARRGTNLGAPTHHTTRTIK